MTPQSGAWSVVPRDLRNGDIRPSGAISAANSRETCSHGLPEPLELTVVPETVPSVASISRPRAFLRCHQTVATQASEHAASYRKSQKGWIRWLSFWCPGYLSAAGFASTPSTVWAVARVASSRWRLLRQENASTAPLDAWSDWCEPCKAPMTAETLIGVGRPGRPKLSEVCGRCTQ